MFVGGDDRDPCPVESESSRADRLRAAQQVSSALDGLERIAEQKRQVGRASDQQFDDEAALKRRKSFGMQF